MFGRKTALVEIPPPGGLPQRRYIDEVLVPNVLPVKEAFGPGFILHEDNVTAHEQDINLLVHPAMSPDLNPIEHLWDSVDRKVRSIVPLPDNMQELRAAVLRAWDEVTLGNQHPRPFHAKALPCTEESCSRVNGDG
ncbi:hypothetical protein FOCC_FOCC004056, partial [Frankliniella occidentalis]